MSAPGGRRRGGLAQRLTERARPDGAHARRDVARSRRSVDSRPLSADGARSACAAFAALASGQRTPVASSHARHRRSATSRSRVIFAAFWRRGSPREPARAPELAALDRRGRRARARAATRRAPWTARSAACRLSANRVSFVGRVDADDARGAPARRVARGARRRSRPAPPPRAAAGRPRTRARSSRSSTARTRASRSTRSTSCGSTGSYGRERGRHAADPDHATGCRGERRQQLAGEREVPEHVRREDDLVAVDASVSRAFGGCTIPALSSTPSRPPAPAHARRGRAHRAEVARVEQERLDGGGRGIRNPPMDRGARARPAGSGCGRS